VSVPARVVTRARCVWLPEETLQRAGLRGLAQKAQSGGREQGRYAACWLGCGRANITEAGARGRRAVIAPRERKLRRTYTPRASPPRARALQIPGAMGRCRRGTPIWSKDGRLCACGLCPRASRCRPACRPHARPNTMLCGCRVASQIPWFQWCQFAPHKPWFLGCKLKPHNINHGFWGSLYLQYS
jgi:hypothetical protein